VSGLTPDLLVQALGVPISKAQAWAAPIAEAATFAHLNTTGRLAAFLGQIGHESMRLRYTRELWGPTPQQHRYEPTTTLSRRLGNTAPGDGRRFAGHGLIQVTGRANHRAATARMRAALGASVPDFEAQPLRLTEPLWAALSAADFWLAHGCNALADAGNQVGLTRRINGGTNGLADRLTLTARARAACLLHGVSP